MRRSKSLAAGVATLVAGAVLALPGTANAVNIGNEGCTPGYWKNHTSNWEEYTTATQLRWMLAARGTNTPYDFPAALDRYETMTMEQALSLKGGSGIDGAAQILLRAATAAFLNAAHEGVGYPYRRFTDPGNLRDQVVAALNSLDRQRMLDLAAELDAANNLGCPLS